MSHVCRASFLEIRTSRGVSWYLAVGFHRTEMPLLAAFVLSGKQPVISRHLHRQVLFTPLATASAGTLVKNCPRHVQFLCACRALVICIIGDARVCI